MMQQMGGHRKKARGRRPRRRARRADGSPPRGRPSSQGAVALPARSDGAQLPGRARPGHRLSDLDQLRVADGPLSLRKSSLRPCGGRRRTMGSSAVHCGLPRRIAVQRSTRETKEATVASSSASCGWARRSSPPTASSPPTPVRPATAGSSRSSGPTTRGASRRPSRSTTRRPSTGSARAPSPPSASRSSQDLRAPGTSSRPRRPSQVSDADDDRRDAAATSAARPAPLPRPCSTTSPVVVDDPDAVRVDVVDGGGRARSSTCSVGRGDMGRVIGKRGRVANAIRTVDPRRRGPGRRRGRRRVPRLIPLPALAHPCSSRSGASTKPHGLRGEVARRPHAPTAPSACDPGTVLQTDRGAADASSRPSRPATAGSCTSRASTTARRPSAGAASSLARRADRRPRRAVGARAGRLPRGRGRRRRRGGDRGRGARRTRRRTCWCSTPARWCRCVRGRRADRRRGPRRRARRPVRPRRD